MVTTDRTNNHVNLEQVCSLNIEQSRLLQYKYRFDQIQPGNRSTSEQRVLDGKRNSPWVILFIILLFKVAFRFGHSQIQHEFRPYINGTKAIFPRAGDTVDDHRLWLLSFTYFRTDPFNIGQGGKSWLNEIEGLIKQKCPEADLRMENALTNELFLKGIREGFHGERIWFFSSDKNLLCVAVS